MSCQVNPLAQPVFAQRLRLICCKTYAVANIQELGDEADQPWMARQVTEILVRHSRMLSKGHLAALETLQYGIVPE